MTGDLFTSAGISVLIVVLVAVLILVIVLVLIAVAVLVVVLGTVVILVIHNILPPILAFAVFRYASIPGLSGFIPGFAKKADNQSGGNSCCDTTGSRFQPSGEDA